MRTGPLLGRWGSRSFILRDLYSDCQTGEEGRTQAPEPLLVVEEQGNKEDVCCLPWGCWSCEGIIKQVLVYNVILIYLFIYSLKKLERVKLPLLSLSSDNLSLLANGQVRSIQSAEVINRPRKRKSRNKPNKKKYFSKVYCRNKSCQF